MFNKSQPPVITSKDELHCKAHSQPIEELKIKTAFNDPELSLLCPQCPKKGLFEKTKKILSTAYSQYDTYIMSFEEVSKAPIKTDPTMPSSLDIVNCRLEHIIIDNQAQGYMLRNLVYIPSKQILAACSNKRIAFYSIGKMVDMKNAITLDVVIEWAKYIKIDEEKEYLMIGADKEVYVYSIKDINNVNCIATLKCENKVNCIDWVSKYNKLVTAGGDRYVRVWNIEDFSFEYTIEVSIRKQEEEEQIYSVTYLEEKNILVVEDKFGIYLIDFDYSNSAKVENRVLTPARYFELANRSEAGFCYLSKLNKFVLKMQAEHTYILDSETLEPQFECLKETTKDQNSREIRYIPNHDGSQILANSSKKCRLMLFYGNKNCQFLGVQGFIKELGDLEIMHDQYRFAVGDRASGTILIFRTNIKTSSDPPSFSVEGAESKPIEAIIAAKKRHLKAKAAKKVQARELLEKGPENVEKRMTRAGKKEKLEEEKEVESDLEDKIRDKEESRRRSHSKKEEKREKKKDKNEGKSRERSKDVEKKRQKKKK